jgi:hypothetical protein
VAAGIPPDKPETNDLSKITTGLPDPALRDQSAQELVDLMYSEGWNARPEVLRAILYKGPEAVEPLLALGQRLLATEDMPETLGERDEFLKRIVTLLAILHDPTAIPFLASAFRLPSEDEDLRLTARDALIAFGPQAVESFLEILRDRNLDKERLAYAATGAARAVGDDLVLRARIGEELRQLLTEELSRPPEDEVLEPTSAVAAESIDDFDEDELEAELAEVDEAPYIDLGDDDSDLDESPDFVTALVANLADLADPLAPDLIRSAFEAGRVEDWFIDPEAVEELYSRGGAPPLEVDLWKRLHEYEEEYRIRDQFKGLLDMMEEQAAEEERQRAEEKARPATAPYEPVQPIRNTFRRPGRNDPCWCGSGKKYKKCHLSQDQAEG